MKAAGNRENKRVTVDIRLSLRGSRRSVNHFNLNEEPVPSGAGFFENRRSAAIFVLSGTDWRGAHELRQQYALSGRHPFRH